MTHDKERQLTQQLQSDPNFKQLTPDQQRSKISTLSRQVTTAEKRLFEQQNGLGQYANNYKGTQKRATKTTQAILQGTYKPTVSKTGKLSSPGGSTSTSDMTPKEKYQNALKHYQTNQNTMSDVQKYAAQKALAKLRIQAPFPSDVISLYGMSKANTYNYLTTRKNTQKLADQLVAYDKALYNAGLTKYQKYRNGLVPASGGSRKRGGSSKKSTGKASITKALAELKAANGAAKPIATPKSPHITVKVAGTPSTYKKTALKHYAVAKPRVSKTA
jgi:hypothetical protein